MDQLLEAALPGWPLPSPWCREIPPPPPPPPPKYLSSCWNQCWAAPSLSTEAYISWIGVVSRWYMLIIEGPTQLSPSSAKHFGPLCKMSHCRFHSL